MDKVTKVVVDNTKVTVEHEGAEPTIQNFTEPAHATEYAEAKAKEAGLDVEVVGAAEVEQEQEQEMAQENASSRGHANRSRY